MTTPNTSDAELYGPPHRRRTDPDGTVPGDSPVGIIAAASILTWAFPLQILHLVLVIAGTVKSAKGTVFDNELALPLLK